MFTIDIKKFTPKFILEDKNGKALAAAIEAGLNRMNAIIKQGVDCVNDTDTMPEWRLDEMAWETQCLYDYNANIETKREWIKNAIPYYRLYGTPQALYKYLSGYFDDIVLEESWVYGGEPFHFRVTVEGEWTPDNEAWARRAIAAAKNVRSILDGLSIGCACTIGMSVECGVLNRFTYPLTGAENWAGRWPQENTLGVIDESGKAAVEANATPWTYPYPLTGTTPEINTLGALDNSAIPSAQADDTYTMILYKLCGQDEI